MNAESAGGTAIASQARDGPFSLEGRLAVVTGGGSGLGRAFCIGLARAGARVVVADTDVGGAEETLGLVGDSESMALQVDVSDALSVDSMASILYERYGSVDILVNNAGIGQRSDLIHETPLATWNNVIAVNLTGTFLCSRALLPLLMKSAAGSVINISSIVGVRGCDSAIMAQGAYAASKAGVVGLTLQMACEYGPFGVRVNAVAPGWHSGTMLGRRVGNYPSDEEREELESLLIPKTPLRRRGSPTEIAGLIVYLASEASSFLTGQVIAHDGGWLSC